MLHCDNHGAQLAALYLVRDVVRVPGAASSAQGLEMAASNRMQISGSGIPAAAVRIIEADLEAVTEPAFIMTGACFEAIALQISSAMLKSVPEIHFGCPCFGLRPASLQPSMGAAERSGKVYSLSACIAMPCDRRGGQLIGKIVRGVDQKDREAGTSPHSDVVRGVQAEGKEGR